jgi:quinoprotein glucose dehydrogenase
MGLAPPSERQVSDLRYMPQFVEVLGPQGLPLINPPWTRLTAIDLNQGTIAWQVPLGDGPRDHPALAGLDLPKLGAAIGRAGRRLVDGVRQGHR